MPRRKRRSISTPRQQAAQIRNFNKRRLSAVYETLRILSKSTSLAQYDRARLALASRHIKNVFGDWDSGYISSLSDKAVDRIAKGGY